MYPEGHDGVVAPVDPRDADWKSPHDRAMDAIPPNFVAAGFTEMWQPVYDKYGMFFESAAKLQPIVSEMVRQPIQGQLPLLVGHMAAAAANTYGALLTLVLNGYGHDAMKLARSLFEVELNILWLKNHPEDLTDFLDYTFIQQKQIYDIFSEEQKKQVPKERYEQMMQEYNRVLPRFATGRDRTRPRSEWCRESLFDRAKEAGLDYLYRTFYRQASSLHHLDIGGISLHLDDEMNAHMAPSWAWLEDALIASGSVLRCISYFDEMAQLGFKERLESGPNQDYVAALKAL